jgi:hypothetical protein
VSRLFERELQEILGTDPPSSPLPAPQPLVDRSHTLKPLPPPQRERFPLGMLIWPALFCVAVWFIFLR